MARIRTIKPEFWTSEQMCLQPEFTRLLALALLNYADDYGYFHANPLLIRGAVFPLLESTAKIEEGLRQLAAIGYVELRTSDDGRQFGSIVNFSIHQRVEKAKDSVIACKYKTCQKFGERSGNDRGGVDDQSPLEGKGREGKGKDLSSCQMLGTAPDQDGDGTASKPPERYPAEFVQFWDVYPNRGGRKRGKDATLKLWQKIPEGKRGLLVTAAISYAASDEALRGYAKDPERFLKNNWWEDWLSAPEPVAKPSRLPTPEEDAAWTPY